MVTKDEAQQIAEVKDRFVRDSITKIINTLRYEGIKCDFKFYGSFDYHEIMISTPITFVNVGKDSICINAVEDDNFWSVLLEDIDFDSVLHYADQRLEIRFSSVDSGL
jgi:hypothetical protein